MFHQNRDGGWVLLGVNVYLHDVLESESGECFFKMLLLDKRSKMRWHLVVLYGPAHIEDKDNFLTEFTQLCNKRKGAVVIGGDFNIIRKTNEKNKPCIFPR
jgi:hypothetical protein